MIYLCVVAVIIPGIIMGYAYIRTAQELMKSIQKVKKMQNENK